MQVIVNGKPVETDEGASLSTLIQGLELDAAALIAERNGAVVPRDEFASCVLAQGDRLELVRLVGGG